MPDSTVTLRNAENNAISHSEPSYDNNSNNGGGFYTGNGRNDSKKKKGGIRGRTAGVIISITLLLGGGAAFLSSSNSLLAPALSSRVTTETQTDFTSYTLRSKYIIQDMMDGSAESVVQQHPWTSKYLKIPSYMRKRFAKYNIEVTGSGKNTRMIWKDQTLDAESFIKLYNENVEFRDDFTKAKRGRVATFFDEIAENFFGKKLGARNVFKDFVQGSNTDADVDNYKSTLSNRLAGNSSDLSTKATKWEVVTEEIDPDSIPNGYKVEVDEETGTTTYYKPIPVDTDASSKSSSIDLEAAKVETRGMIANIAGTVGEVGDTLCTALKVGSMIGMTAAAIETYNNINYFLTQIESVSKMMAGEGNGSAVNELLNFLSTSATTNVSDFDGVSFDFLAGQQPANNEDLLSQKQETGSPLEASGLQNMLALAPIAIASTQNYSSERVLRSMGGAMTMTSGKMKTCAGINIAQSIASIATTLATGGLAKIVSSVITSTAINVATTTTVSAFFSFLVPTLAKLFFSNAADLIGIPAGHSFAAGAAATNMQEGRRGSGQSISGKAAVQAFNNSTQQVLAMEAELDRHNLSPFDTSNPNTFFGSIAYSLLPTLTSTNMTGISSLIRSTTKSLSSLLSHASATSNENAYLAHYGNCLLLEEIGAVGDVYCHPISTTDMSTINLSPNDVNYVNAISNNVENCDSSSAPSSTSTSATGSDITIIGDSITNGARSKLSAKLPGIEIRAQDSKFFSVDRSGNPSGLSIIKDSGFSPRKNVVFALGTNQSNLTQDDIKQVIDTLGSDHEIYFITNYKLSSPSTYAHNNNLFTQATANHHNVHVIDWANAVSADPSAYITNADGLGVHPTSAGQDLFVNLIYNAAAKNSNDDDSDDSGSLGNCSIKPNSNLAKYIAFCDNRDSPFGAIDQNILGALESDFSIINSIPVIGDFASIVNGLQELDENNLAWANGARCGNTDQNKEFWESEGKYYQRYIEDQRILEQMGAFEGSKNPVTAFTEEYEKQYEATHPEANTYIGYLSRISGLTVENTETVLAFVEYYNFVDQYDPTLRIAMDGDASESQSGEQVVANIQNRILRFDDSNIDTPLYADTSKYIAYVDYSDLRNRSYAA